MVKLLNFVLKISSNLIFILAFFDYLKVIKIHVSSSSVEKLSLKEVVFIVLSQENSFHARRYEVFKNKFKDQALELKEDTYSLLSLHEDWPHSGSWTLFPIISDLSIRAKNKKWVFFCEEDTFINLKKVLEVLQRHDHTLKLFLGKSLHDVEPTIIHHFAFHESDPTTFNYPDFAAGMALSVPLIKRLAKVLVDTKNLPNFSIDPKYEFAKFIYEEAKQVALIDVPEFCTDNIDFSCATRFTMKLPDCGMAIDTEDIVFAVKTYHKNHVDRIPVIQNTWAKDVKHIIYFSDIDDGNIPTINLGIKNTDRGHCAKTHAILKYLFNNQQYQSMKWIVIADDDTLLSIPRLRKLLSCYKPYEAVALGERYGYVTAGGHGYDYLTGGAGIVLSKTAFHELVNSATCSCNDDNDPDDMVIFGSCLRRLSIPVTNSPVFHQARPYDYSASYLSHQLPVSFHKFWNCDPYKVNEEWLHDTTILHHHDEF